MIVLGTGQALRAAFTRLGDTAAVARVNARIDAAVHAIEKNFIRPELEAVLESVLADGTPTHHAKGSLWKGPFHLPRMHLACWQRLERRLAHTGG